MRHVRDSPVRCWGCEALMGGGVTDSGVMFGREVTGEGVLEGGVAGVALGR